jgi:hypothetical protein
VPMLKEVRDERSEKNVQAVHKRGVPTW